MFSDFGRVCARLVLRRFLFFVFWPFRPAYAPPGDGFSRYSILEMPDYRLVPSES